MKSEKENTIYFAIDGDDVGAELRSIIITNQNEEITEYSEGIKNYFIKIESWLNSFDATIIFRGGDSILATLDKKILVRHLGELPKGKFSVSGGIGLTAEYAYLALQLAKARGKAQIVEIKDIDVSTIKTLKIDPVVN